MLKVKELRISQRMSQSELARRARVNQTSMSRIERGLEPAFPRRGARIAEALEWTGSLEELFGEVGCDDGDSSL